MTSVCEKNISAEVRLIHAEQVTLYKFHRFKKKQQTPEDQTSQARHFKSMGNYGFS